MNKASPAEVRKSLEMVDVYVKAGIGFVPIPVLNDEDNNKLVGLANVKLERILKDMADTEPAL